MMAAFTACVLGAFGIYGLSLYLGSVEGNFALLLFCASVVTGLYWLAEQFYFLPERRRAAQVLGQQMQSRDSELTSRGIDPGVGHLEQAQQRVLMQPWWLDWTAGLFPVIVTVFLLRSFLFEPFKIPSASMMPTLLVGDLILVNKFTYGLRLPVLNIKITQGQEPQRGDVMVFRYPPRPNQDYIKRVVGVPGDEVAYLNKTLTVNGLPVSKQAVPDFLDEETTRYLKQYEEQLGTHTHRLLNNEERPPYIQGADAFPFRDNCRYSAEGVVCRVPAGHYFMMGDNRDNSLDSRYWGFVPDQNIVGRAFMVWMNFGNLARIGFFH